MFVLIWFKILNGCVVAWAGRDGNTCKGEIMQLNHDEIEQAVLQANEQLGESWRLPTSDEVKILFAKPVHRQKSISFCSRLRQPNLIGQAKQTHHTNLTCIRLTYTGHRYGNFFPIGAWRSASCATPSVLLRFR